MNTALRKAQQTSTDLIAEFEHFPAYKAEYADAEKALGSDRASGTAILAARDSAGVKVVKNRYGPIGYQEWDQDGIVII